jgi:DNA-3-methyladenine glycosylase II
MNPSSELTIALAHLRERCEVMASLIDTHRPPRLNPVSPERYFDVLVCSIVGQQLSVRAADTIEARLRALVGELQPRALLAKSDDDLRAIGLSRSKVAYAKGIAEAFLSGRIDPQQLESASDDEVVESLTALKGIGPWTAQMFQIFGLARLDIWSPGDLGLSRALEHFFGSAEPELAERWRPYRSVAAWYLWEHSDQLVGRKVDP